MRLDFNIVIVDDDLEDDDNNAAVKALIKKLENQIENKGFIPNVYPFSSVDAVKKDSTINHGRRIDFFLSDNNLGDNSNHENLDQKNGGIDYYLSLRKNYICDFVLYTRSQKKEIIKKLIDDLNKNQDPNLFSRFTFVSRNIDNDWHEPITTLIDHILTKREEINNLRGLYAQQTSLMHNRLRELVGDTNLDMSFKNVINKAYDMRVGDKNSRLVDHPLKGYLENQRDIRNGVIHNDEKFCEIKKRWYIEYKSNSSDKRLYENEFSTQRKHLSETVKLVFGLKNRT